MNRLRLALILFVNMILQSAFFSRMPVFGAQMNLSIPIVVNIGVLMGPVPGSLCGAIAGLLEDIQTGRALGVRALLYFFIGYFAGSMQKHVSRDDPKPAMAITLISTLFFFLSNAFVSRILSVTTGFLLYLRGPVFIEAVLNALIGFLIYKLLKRFLKFPGLYR